MRPADNIEKHVKKNKLQVSSDPRMDEKVLADSFDAMEQAMQNKQADNRPDIWRNIMQSRISKLTIAAIIIIAVLIGIKQFGGSIDGCSIVLADVVKNMKEMPWVHCSVTIEHSGQKVTEDHWVCFDPSIIAAVSADGSISYFDFGKKKLYEYKPGSNTITISPKTDEYNLPGPGSPVEIIPAMIDSARERNAEISSEQTQLDGVSVEIIRMVSKVQDVTLVCDVERNLVISMTTEAVIPDSGMKATAHAIIDYPDEGPQDIYALGVPEDAAIIDTVPKGNLKDLTDEIRRRFDNGIGDHTAVILESYVEDEGVLEPSAIIIMRQKGKLKRFDNYFVYNSSNHISLYEDVKDRWPDLTLEDIKGLVKDEALVRQMLFDGKQTHTHSSYSGRVQKQQIRTDMFKISPSDSLAGIIWVNPQVVMLGNADTDEVLELLDADAEHEGLMGFRVTRTPSSGHDSSSGIDDYWFDPEKDYMLVERVSKNEIGKGSGFPYSRTIVDQAGKTSDGKWYPVVISHESTYISHDGKTSNRNSIKHILVDVDSMPDQNLFDPKSLME